jgi:hypothetical protein
LCARGISGKRLFEGNGRDTRGIASDFVRALNEATEVKRMNIIMICIDSTLQGRNTTAEKYKDRIFWEPLVEQK